MKQLITKITWLGLFATTLVLTACGGGGGGGSSFTPPDINETPVAITAANQNAIALSVDAGINGTVAGGDVALGAVIVGSGSSPSAFNFASTKLLDYAKQGAAATVNLPAGVVDSATIDCGPTPDYGTMTITIDIADPDFLVMVAGDSLSISSNSCNDGMGTTINGSFSFTIDSGSIILDCPSNCPDVAIAVNFNNLRITESGLTAAIHGGFTMAVSEIDGTSSVSGTSLYLIAGADAIRLTNFNIDSSTTGSTTSSTVTMTIASTLIDGSITIETLDPILQDVGELHPHAGIVRVTGAGEATLTIVYVDSTQVNFYLDPDGDGPEPEVETLGVLWTDM